MSLAILIPSPTVQTGDITVEVTPPVAGTLAITTSETTGAFAIPAGCLWVKIRNAGFVQDGDLEEEATVAGSSWSVGREEVLTAFLDEVLGVYKRLPAIAGNGNGSRVLIAYAT